MPGAAIVILENTTCDMPFMAAYWKTYQLQHRLKDTKIDASLSGTAWDNTAQLQLYYALFSLVHIGNNRLL